MGTERRAHLEVVVPEEPSSSPAADSTSDAGAEESEDLRERFRAALDRKKSARHDPHGDGTSARGVGPASNDKRQRQFRRKSG
jgi:adenylosuccinate synthase